MLTRFSFFVAMLAFGLVACEGPAGPMGPVGPRGETGAQGPQGRSGIAAFTLIEETLDDDEWNVEFNSYYLNDSRIQPITVAGVYVKQFYTNTGDPYYTPFSEWVKENTSVIVLYQVLSGGIRFFDPSERLEHEIVVIAVTGQ